VDFCGVFGMFANGSDALRTEVLINQGFENLLIPWKYLLAQQSINSLVQFPSVLHIVEPTQHSKRE
jgi:hypothetical protein